MNAVPYQPDRPAASAHHSLKTSLEAMDRARHSAVLWFADIRKRGLYRELGYGSMRQYAVTALGFSSSRCGEFQRLAETLDALPRLRGELARGRLGYTKAAEIIKVATPRTEARWIETGLTVNRRDLAVKVKSVRVKARRRRRANPDQGSLLDAMPADPANPTDPAVPTDPVDPVEVPMRVSIPMTPLQYARYEALIERAYTAGGGAPDKAEALLAGLDAAAGTSASATPSHSDTCANVSRRRVIPPAARIVIQKCPDCGRAAVVTGRGERAISLQTLARVECDAIISEPGRANRATIPPSRRREAFERARYRCETKGCDHTRFLEVHHIVPRAQGGSNALENLRVLCSRCHGWVHRRERSAVLRE